MDYQKYISEAEGYRNNLIPRARGEGQAKVYKAKARRKNMELKALGETARFLHLSLIHI